MSGLDEDQIHATHAWEQFETMAGNMAETVAAYYRRLHDKAVPEWLAYTLTIEFQRVISKNLQ